MHAYIDVYIQIHTQNLCRLSEKHKKEENDLQKAIG